MNRRLTIRIHPVTARRMTSDDIWLRAFDLHILLTRILTGFHPFECLARCHIQVRLAKRIVLLRSNSFRAQITWSASFQILLHGSVHTLRGGQSVFRLIHFAQSVHLLRTDPLCDRSGRCNRVLTPECNKSHLKRGHLRSRTNSHRVTRACVKRRIPHLMS
jgi:hypothetical protein